MPHYFYTAKSLEGQTKTGNVFADDIFQLRRILRDENLFLLKAASGSEKQKGRFDVSLPFLGVSSVEKIMMTRNLWIMFDSGLSLVKIFTILSDQAKNKTLKNLMLDVAERLNKGESLSDALAHYPKVFNDFFLSMVKIGEESGTLTEIFEILSTHMDRDHELRGKIKGALIYPCIVLVVMACIGVVISIFVLPKFSAFLLGMGVPLPLYTKILIGIGEYSQKYWYLAIIIPLVFMYGIFLSMKTRIGRLVRDTVFIRLPLLSPFIKKANSTIIIRSLSSLNASGISLIRALEITSATAGNSYFKAALTASMEKVKKGEKLSSALKEYAGLFPFGTVDMMEVGEETGKTSIILKKLAEFYEKEVVKETENFSRIIEPILIIFLGLVVAFFAISIIEPMYASFSNIG